MQHDSVKVNAWLLRMCAPELPRPAECAFPPSTLCVNVSPSLKLPKQQYYELKCRTHDVSNGYTSPIDKLAAAEPLLFHPSHAEDIKLFKLMLERFLGDSAREGLQLAVRKTEKLVAAHEASKTC
eukprot:1820816-Amphidinium_carterae.2